MSIGKKITHDFLHDFTQRALPSMKHLMSRAQKECDLRTDIIVATTQKSYPKNYLKSLTKNVSLVLVFEKEMTQFHLASEALEALASLLRWYDLVLMTRDDFVYADFAWDIIAAKYDPAPNVTNFVNADCYNNTWDGLHIFRGDEADLYGIAFASLHRKSAHLFHIPQHHQNFLVDGMHGQPDRCHPALGFVDRTSNASDTLDAHHPFRTPSSCCTDHIKQVLDMKPVLDRQKCPRLIGGVRSSEDDKHEDQFIVEPSSSDGNDSGAAARRSYRSLF